jgi:hypothetical protein
MKRLLAYLTLGLTLACSSCTDLSLMPAPESGPGQLRLYLIDAPAALDEVNINVARVEVHRASNSDSSGWSVINDVPATYNLMQLRNGANAVLGDTTLAPGTYTQIRLILGPGSNVKVGDESFDLRVPSGFQTGIKLNHEFTIQAGTLVELLLDFDAERSIRRQGAGYRMSPVIRVNAMVISGSISGTVDPPAAHAFVFTLDGTDTISTAADTTTGFFRLMGLSEALYDIHISSLAGTYNDTTISGVQVVKQTDIDLGIIQLSEK